MISIVIPTLNSGKFLAKTLESIHEQEYSDYEVIVVDSNSDDDTLRIAYEYHKRMDGKLNIYLMPREGQVRAINYGMSLTKGDILTFINSNDTYEYGCFKMVDYILSYRGVEWLYGIGKVIDAKGKEVRSLVTNFKSLWWIQNSERILSWFDYIVQPTVFWKRSLWEKVGKFNPEFPMCFDYDYWLRARRISKPLFLECHLANWRAHSDSISVRDTNRQIDESLRINMPYAKGSGDMMIQGLIAWIEKVVYGVMK